MRWLLGNGSLEQPVLVPMEVDREPELQQVKSYASCKNGAEQEIKLASIIAVTIGVSVDDGFTKASEDIVISTTGDVSKRVYLVSGL